VEGFSMGSRQKQIGKRENSTRKMLGKLIEMKN